MTAIIGFQATATQGVSNALAAAIANAATGGSATLAFFRNFGQAQDLVENLADGGSSWIPSTDTGGNPVLFAGSGSIFLNLTAVLNQAAATAAVSPLGQFTIGKQTYQIAGNIELAITGETSSYVIQLLNVGLGQPVAATDFAALGQSVLMALAAGITAGADASLTAAGDVDAQLEQITEASEQAMEGFTEGAAAWRSSVPRCTD